MVLDGSPHYGTHHRKLWDTPNYAVFWCPFYGTHHRKLWDTPNYAVFWCPFYGTHHRKLWDTPNYAVFWCPFYGTHQTMLFSGVHFMGHTIENYGTHQTMLFSGVHFSAKTDLKPYVSKIYCTTMQARTLRFLLYMCTWVSRAYYAYRMNGRCQHSGKLCRAAAKKTRKITIISTVLVLVLVWSR